MTEVEDSSQAKQGASADRAAPAAPLRLHSFEGGPGPAVVAEAWATFRTFDQSLRDELAVLLHEMLIAADNPANVGRFKAFCEHFKVSSDTLSPVVEGLHLMMGHACASGVVAEQLGADFNTLDGGENNLGDAIAEMYGRVQPRLRSRIVDDTLADHGALLVGVDWRVDELKVSGRGTGLDTSVMHLTLRYREGNETSRVTLQLVPEMARVLRDACARVVG